MSPLSGDLIPSVTQVQSRLALVMSSGAANQVEKASSSSVEGTKLSNILGGVVIVFSLVGEMETLLQTKLGVADSRVRAEATPGHNIAANGNIHLGAVIAALTGLAVGGKWGVVEGEEELALALLPACHYPQVFMADPHLWVRLVARLIVESNDMIRKKADIVNSLEMMSTEPSMVREIVEDILLNIIKHLIPKQKEAMTLVLEQEGDVRYRLHVLLAGHQPMVDLLEAALPDEASVLAPFLTQILPVLYKVVTCPHRELLAVLEGLLDIFPVDFSYDILMRDLDRYHDKDDPKVRPISDNLINTLATPSHMKKFPPFTRSGWGLPGFKLCGGSPKKSVACLDDETKEDLDPYRFVVCEDVVIEAYNFHRKFCKDIVNEIANKVVDIISDSKLDSIINSVIDDEQLRTRERNLKRIFESVIGDEEEERLKTKKTLDEIFEEALGESFNASDDELVQINKTAVCSKSCPSKLCCKTSPKLIEKIQAKVCSMRSSELHNFLLGRLATQREMGIDSLNIFIVDKTTFCHDSFKAFFGISDYLLGKVLLEHQSGITGFIHGNQGNLYVSPDRDHTIAFIIKFAEVHSENLPDRSCLRLPSYLNIKCIFNYYCERTDVQKRVSERSFYSIFKTYFGDTNRQLSSLPRIVFQPFHTHPVCVTCSRLSDLRKTVKNESEAKYAEVRKKTHMLEIRQKYIKFATRRELAIRYSEDYLHLGIDDMDQSKLQSPYYCQNTKDLSNLLRLNNHLTGCIVTNGKLKNDREYMVFLNNDQFAQDSNKTISILFHILSSLQSRFGSLPRKLMLQTDNCGKDLKNQILLAFYYFLVERNIFEEVTVTSMPVGHTHNDVDWMFGIIAQKLKKIDLPSFEALKSELSKIEIQSQALVVTEMTHTSDFKKFIEDGHLLKIQGHRCFAQFVIRKENKAAKLYLKFDELDDNYQFPNGISLLKNMPEVVKLSVSPFRQETAYSDIFESVWKKYIPSLSPKFDEEAVAKIKYDWEKRIKFLIQLKERNFEAFDFHRLKCQPSPVAVPDHSQLLQSKSSVDENVSVTATFYPMDMSKLSAMDLKKDVSLVLYTETKKWRPWVCLFDELSEDGLSVTVQWLKKENQKYVLHLNRDGSPYLSLVPNESIMFADVLENLSPVDAREGPYKLSNFVKQEIVKAYEEQDQKLRN